jgi:hypothetical protein
VGERKTVRPRGRLGPGSESPEEGPEEDCLVPVPISAKDCLVPIWCQSERRRTTNLGREEDCLAERPRRRLSDGRGRGRLSGGGMGGDCLRSQRAQSKTVWLSRVMPRVRLSGMPGRRPTPRRRLSERREEDCLGREGGEEDCLQRARLSGTTLVLRIWYCGGPRVKDRPALRLGYSARLEATGALLGAPSVAASAMRPPA